MLATSDPLFLVPLLLETTLLEILAQLRRRSDGVKAFGVGGGVVAIVMKTINMFRSKTIFRKVFGHYDPD